MKQTHGIAEVLDSPTGLDGIENFLEKVDAVADTRLYSRIYGAGSGSSRGIVLGKRTAEMNPIDGPGIVGVGAIDMRSSSGDNEILVATHFVAVGLVGADLEKTTAVYTIYKYILVNGLIAAPIMVGGLGIISYIGYVEHRHQWVFIHNIHNFFRQDNGTLAFEAVF